MSPLVKVTSRAWAFTSSAEREMVGKPFTPTPRVVMADDLDLEIRISDDIVEFKLDGVDYRGRSQLGSSEVLDRLDELRREGDALEYGQSLFRATFCDSRHKAGLEMLRSWLSQHRDENCGLRLVVDLDCARLHSLWWECL